MMKVDVLGTAISTMSMAPPWSMVKRTTVVSWNSMIHDENPFVDAPEGRDPIRRFRGRLTAPVTVVTSGAGEARAGLTVSSLNVIEGEPGVVELVVGPTSDLWDVVADSGGFVVHICRSSDRALAEVFAGLRPSPGGMFAGLEVTEAEFGPVIETLGDRAHCRFTTREEIGYSGVVSGAIDHIDVGDLVDPLLYFRGGYRGLEGPR
jgi:3-hydroxy-9,10-secoandrosta-1,3,5(10)-triene-9,17-dione monooxygenase reductase component